MNSKLEVVLLIVAGVFTVCALAGVPAKINFLGWAVLAVVAVLLVPLIL